MVEAEAKPSIPRVATIQEAVDLVAASPGRYDVIEVGAGSVRGPSKPQSRERRRQKG